jgi:starch synthase (maltosyl-transferring)
MLAAPPRKVRRNEKMAIQEYGKVLIEGVLPQIDGGTYPIKRVLGDTITVSADVYKEGHDKLVALLKYRLRGADAWQEVPMSAGHNDRWTGSFKVDTIGKYEYTIEAYAERYLSWLDELGKKNRPRGEPDQRAA